MIKCGFLLYRNWGLGILKGIAEFRKVRPVFDIETIITIDNPEFEIEELKNYSDDVRIINPNDSAALLKIVEEKEIEILFCYTWSWILREPLINKCICLALHPSKLPQGRGGSPIQNQIIAGIKESAVTIFRIDKGIDNGPVYFQTAISFAGDVEDIFMRMTDVGIIATKQLIRDRDNGELQFAPQKDSDLYPPFKRRTPEMSRLEIGSICKMDFEEMNDFVRCLTYPYPNAYMEIGGQKVLIQAVEKYRKIPTGVMEVKEDTKIKPGARYAIKLNDSWAELTKYSVD